MFAGFAHVWTPVLAARRVRLRPVRAVVAGEPIVFFQNQTGKFGALIDRCPHRSVALSIGKVCLDGCLECPFHGWRFDVSGVNRLVPLNPGAKRELLNATALPVRQIGELLWIYTAPGAEAPIEPIVPDGLSATDLSRSYTEREWSCHWTRAMENMLDSPHLPFVHRRTIGRTYRRQMTATSRMDIHWEDTEWGGRARAILDGNVSPATLEFYRPNVMALTIPIPGRHLRIHALVVPTEIGRSRLTVVGSRDFLTLRVFDPLFAWMNGLIADEDKRIVESTGAAEIPPPGEEPSVATDRATLQFRKYYYERLRNSNA